MDADHVTAWSNGGDTDLANCEMPCITHNRAKGEPLTHESSSARPQCHQVRGATGTGPLQTYMTPLDQALYSPHPQLRHISISPPET